MRPLSFSHDQAVDRLCAQVESFVAAVGGCDEWQLLGASRAHGWSLLDVAVHVRMGLEEMTVGTTAVVAADADHDAASYWESHADDRDADPVPHVLYLRRVASAYQRPASAVAHLRSAGDSTARAVRAMREGVVEFQGKRMTSGDFLATWVVELAIHQLDMDLPDDEPPGLDWSRATLEALVGADLPAVLDDSSAVLAGLGRVPAPAGITLPDGFPASL